MLKIRTEQIEALSVGRREEFKRHLVEHLRKHHPEPTAKYPDDVLMAYAELCIERAKNHYGITTERGVAFYAQMHWVLGLDFEANPKWEIEVDLLRHPSFHPTDRARVALALAYQFRARGD